MVPWGPHIYCADTAQVLPMAKTCPASEVTVMVGSLLIDISVEDTAFLQPGEERVELSSQRADKFKSLIKIDSFMITPKIY